MTPEDAAFAVIDEGVEGYNAHDPERVAASYNFPHVRMASGRVSYTETRDEWLATRADHIRVGQLEPGWAASTMDRKEVVHASADKVHVAVHFTRFDADGNELNGYDSLYVVTCIDGHWGTQARSSFAP